MSPCLHPPVSGGSSLVGDRSMAMSQRRTDVHRGWGIGWEDPEGICQGCDSNKGFFLFDLLTLFAASLFQDSQGITRSLSTLAQSEQML